MKKLIVVSHPHLEISVINKRWIEELEKYPDQFVIHDLYKLYPNGIIDVEKEQNAIEKYDTMILQYPLYWFNCPPLLKQWLDEVFVYGWAYGSKGDKMKGKGIALAISVGIEEKEYQLEGEYRVTMDQLSLPFRATIAYMDSVYKGLFALYDTHEAPKSNTLEQSAKDYIDFAMKV